MTDKNDVPNSGMSIFIFYFFKGLLLLMSLIAGFIAYSEGAIGNSNWYFYALGTLSFAFLSDAIAMPIEKDKKGIRYHHLWRTSYLSNTEAHVIDIGTGGWFKWQSKENEDLLFARGKYYWKMYIVSCDRKNLLSKLYKTTDH